MSVVFQLLLEVCAELYSKSKLLTALTNSVSLEWTLEYTTTFEMLQKAVCSAAVFKRFGPKLPALITADTFKYVYGAGIKQMEYERAHSVSCYFEL